MSLFRWASCWLFAVIMLGTAPTLAFAQTPQPEEATPGPGANNAPANPGEKTPPAGVQPQVDPLTETDQKPGVLIDVTLTNGALGKRMPFDIPFYLTVTNTETAVTNMSLRIYEVAQRASVSALATELQNTPNCVSPTLRSRATATARRSASNTFSLLIDDLEPQRYYILCFVSGAPLDPSVIAADVRTIIRDTAAALVVVTPNVQPPDVSQAFGDQVYARLQAQIERLGARQVAPAGIPRDNVFFPGTRMAQRSKFALSLVPFIRAYRLLDFSAPGYLRFRRDREAFFKAIEAALNDAALKTDAGAEITQAVRDVLPASDLGLPDRSLAITSTATIDLSDYDFENTKKALSDAADKTAKLPNGAAAAAALTNAATQLDNIAGEVAIYMSSFANLRTATQPLMDLVALETQQVTVNFGATVLTADMNKNAYVSLDAGIAYPWRLENMVFYAGTNIYFRPINKEAPLRYKGTFLHRFAMTVGVTTTVKDDSRRASDLRPTENDADTSNSLLLGAGLRLTPSIRVGAGALIFKESDPNPLITQKSVTATPYVSFTADVNVAAIFKSFFPPDPE